MFAALLSPLLSVALAIAPIPVVRHVISFYDFEHPISNGVWERDLGRSGTHIQLINGGAAMRVRDGAHRFSRYSLQLKQMSPGVAGNDDWKAGVYSETGVPTLRAFNGVKQMTVMGWFKMTGQNPSPNNGGGFYSAIGLAGVLSGDSNGHTVRALLEVIEVDGTLRVVALARRVDGGNSQTFAADADWRTLLPDDRWVHLAATFDFDTGEMALYHNGRPVTGFYTVTGDPWLIDGPPEPDYSTATDPRGIKIGGSYPQNNREGNPCNCRMDDLIFLDRALGAGAIAAAYSGSV